MASNLVVARGGVEYVPPISLAFWRWTVVFLILLPFTLSSIKKNYKVIKKEYKKVTGDTLTLTAQDELEAIVQNTSRVRSWVQAHRFYKIGGIKDVTPVGEASEERLNKSFKDWLSLGKNDTAR